MPSNFQKGVCAVASCSRMRDSHCIFFASQDRLGASNPNLKSSKLMFSCGSKAHMITLRADAAVSTQATLVNAFKFNVEWSIRSDFKLTLIR